MAIKQKSKVYFTVSTGITDKGGGVIERKTSHPWSPGKGRSKYKGKKGGGKKASSESVIVSCGGENRCSMKR